MPSLAYSNIFNNSSHLPLFYIHDPWVWCPLKTFRSTGDFLCERAKVEACLKDINSWMLSNNLKLNNDKTELLVLHSKYRSQPSLDVVSVGNTQVSPSDEVRNLDAIFDSTMDYERHISEICKSAFYHIRNISHVAA